MMASTETMAMSKSTPAQQAALVALLHDEHTVAMVSYERTAIVTTSPNDYYRVRLAYATLNTLITRGWVSLYHTGFQRKAYALTAGGRKFAATLQAEQQR